MDAPSFQRAFGARIRALREGAGFTQKAVAAHADLDRGAYGKLERGEMNATLVTLARIAVGLDLTLSQLLDAIVLDAAETRALPRSQRGPKPIGSARRG